jgi:acetylornithine deacetylase/succinyl-diaminopimelate desuccinylase-like protein
MPARDNACMLAALVLAATLQSDVLREFTTFLSIPNVASDTANIEKNAQWIVDAFARRGITARLLRLDGAPPLVVADWRNPQAHETIAFYAHYDGQPVDPAQWDTPPWQPAIKGDRIYARSASDDKAPIMAMLAAIDRVHTPAVNVKFVFEGEEEAGSPHLARYLKKYADELYADAWMLCDGPVHQSRRMQLYFGARGVTEVEITTYGPSRALHSGHYGNWAPNPVVTLAALIAAMRDTNAKILIPGFYDDVAPLTPAERQALAEIPPVEDELRREYALGRTEGASLNEQILQPALNLRGISAGHVGSAAANAIPTEATASIDFRLVPSQTPEHVRALVESWLASRGDFVVHDTPDAATRMQHANVVKLVWGSGYPPARTAMDSALAKRTAAAIAKALGQPPLRLPSLGGSIPMYLFQRDGRTPVVGVPIVNHDNNQHAANENLRLQNLWDGIDVFVALFGM